MTTTTRTVTTTAVSDAVCTLFTVIEDSREPGIVRIESGADTVCLDAGTLDDILHTLNAAAGRIIPA